MAYLSPDDWLNVFSLIAPEIDSASERRQTIRTFLPDMLDSGYTGQAALNLFRQEGLGVATSTFYSIRFDILNDPSLSNHLRTLGLEEEVAENSLRITTRSMDTKFQYVSSYAITNPQTDETKFGEFSFFANETYTKQFILDSTISAIRAMYPIGANETLTVNLRRGYVNPAY